MRRNRSNGEGTIYRLNNGKYKAEIIVGRDEQGHPIRKTKTNSKKTVVSDWLADIRSQVNKNMLSMAKDINLSDWLVEWLDTYIKIKKKARTYEYYNYIIFGHILKDPISKVPINKITSHMIQKFLNKKWEHYPDSTIKKIRQVLIASLRKADELGLINKNPATYTGVIRVTSQIALNNINEEILLRFIESFDEYKYRVLFATKSLTGLRKGEIFAIKWKDVCLDTNEIRINKSIVELKKETAEIYNKPQRSESQTKTEASNRVMPISSSLHTILSKYKESLGLVENLEEQYVFPSEVGTPICNSTYYRKFKKAMTKASIDEQKFKPHSLRHLFASYLAKNKVNAKVIQLLLGHAHIETVFDFYVHADKEQLHSAVNELNSKMSEKIKGGLL